jgi:hypothetical protein
MKALAGIAISVAVLGGAVIAAPAADPQGNPLDPRTWVRPIVRERPKQPIPPQVSTSAKMKSPAAAPSEVNNSAGFSTPSPFSDARPVSSAVASITPPVIINFSGNAPTVNVGNSGTGQAIEAQINNTKNGASALFGQTNGHGAGVSGYNTGPTGFAAKFGLTNTGNAQSSVFATTAGTGNALLATITNDNSTVAAIFGENNTPYDQGTGVEGYGYYGVMGRSSGDGPGVYGVSSDGPGVSAFSQSGFASLYSFSLQYAGVYAATSNGEGLHAEADYQGMAIYAHSTTGGAVYATSDAFYAIWGHTNGSIAVTGQDDGNGYGVYGSSVSGYAGYFAGRVGAQSFDTISDRNAKSNFKPVDGKDILERVDRLPITSWDFKTDRKNRHLGPMAQDFHAAFGLDGDDDTHINLADISGISLAAIQELSAQMKIKDAQIAELKQQIAIMSAAFEARLTAIEKERVPSLRVAAVNSP